MATATERPSRSLGGIRQLPRPYVITTILKIVAILTILGGIAWVVLMWTGRLPLAPGTTESLLVSAAILVAAAIGATVFYALALLIEYNYHTALNIRMAERRHVQKEAEAAAAGQTIATSAALNDEVVVLLREINENTLLADSDKARKRVRMEESRRDLKVQEIERFIAATKWAVARERIEDFRAEYPDDGAASELRRQLEDAIKEHQQLEIMTTSEQIRSYMSLGLWERARETAGQLARKYPQEPEAVKMVKVVVMEEKGHEREDVQRLYREIEHLVTRKHYREARRSAAALVQRYPDSPEAATLRGQMDELARNADIETRREMESQIIEFSRQNRHKEAYEVAKLLVEQYPESPQALALKDQIDKLRERAGVTA